MADRDFLVKILNILVKLRFLKVKGNNQRLYCHVFEPLSCTCTCIITSCTCPIPNPNLSLTYAIGYTM